LLSDPLSKNQHLKMSKQESLKILKKINSDYKLQKNTIQHILSKKEYLHIKDYLLVEYYEISIRIFKDKVIINISTSTIPVFKNEF
jgi:hypothetical protein